MSRRHGDVYFSAEDGLAESRHVFLAGNGLPEAWRGRRLFVIGETGFGTGLNFLAVWDLWRRTASPASRLHFLSVEGFPLSPGDLERAHRPFTEFAALSARLRALYPHLYGGFHRLHFDDDRVTLTLLFGEAGEMLDALDAQVDAWFLDGFSPARNPDLWRPDVLGRIGALTRPGGAASTFTVAGAVRRGLEAAGITVEKAPGFGRKRHMLRAKRRPEGAAIAPDTDIPATALIVGAGLAGSAAARALARRGVSVTLIDPDPELHQAASGNPAGLAYPRPSADSSPAGRFHCAAFDYAERHLFRPFPEIFTPCGVLELAAGEQALRRHGTLAGGRVLPASAMQALTPEEASAAAGIPVSLPALRFPQGGLLRPGTCAALMRGAAEVRSARVTALHASDCGWTAELDSGDRIAADIAVLACAMDAAALGASVPMAASRGQISLAPATAQSAALRTALTFGAFVTPPLDGCHLLGATYDDASSPPDASARAERQEDHRRNHAALLDALPEFPLPGPKRDWRGRVAFRCTTPDRLPLCGTLPDSPARQPDAAPRISYRKGLYILSGLGSRGQTTAAWLGEFLAGLASGDPSPAERVVTDLLHPARFFARALRRAGFRPSF